MIIIKIEKKDTIEKALKALKGKVIKTKQTQKLVSKKEFVKKSVWRRNQIKKAIWKQKNQNFD